MTKPSSEPSSSSPLKTVGVIGSGTMGAGIAQIAAQKGFTVRLYDVSAEPLERAMARIRETLAEGKKRGKVSAAEIDAVENNLIPTHDLNHVSQASLIIEAVPEDPQLKKQLFQELDALAPPETILASNTSSLSIAGMAGATKRPERVAGLHFFNPVALMKLVEVIQAQQTSTETVLHLLSFVKTLGKTPVVAKDTPGFIVNRVARPFYGEALKLLGENVASVEVLDTLMKQSGGFRMGPFELMDLIGLDVNFAVTQSVYNATFQEARYRPHPIQQRMVESGLLGKKAGKGFYSYE